MRAQHFGSRECEFGRKEPGVVADYDGWRFRFREQVAGDGRGGPADAGESEILGDNSSPAGSAEMDRLLGHGTIFYLGAPAARIGYSWDCESARAMVSEDR